MGTGKIDSEGVRNIILDLGGVILELDVKATIMAFHKLGFPRLETAEMILSKHPFFYDFETGKMSAKNFIEKIMEISGHHTSPEEILDAWNAMLLGYRKDSIERVLELGRKYRLFLLSNTNEIHEVHYNRQLKAGHEIENLDRIFEKVYYSHRLKMAKPDPEIFRYVLRDSRLLPEESLYVDDTLVNVETARSLGIRAYHLVAPERIKDIL